MKTIVTYICIILTSTSSSAQQYAFHNNVQVKPAQDEYIRLSDIPFENAVRAISTPPRDHVPIHEHQHDIPPPPRPQPVQNQENQQLYNQYNPTQSYTPVYNNAPNAPMSFQYMALRDYPNEIYNLLYHTNSGSSGGDYLQAPYNPFDIAGHHGHGTVQQIPSAHNIAIPQNIKIVPSYNHIQSSVPSDFKPSLQIHPGITDFSDNKQFISSFPVSRFKKAKNVILPNVRYANNIPNVNGFIPSKNYPIRI